MAPPCHSRLASPPSCPPSSVEPPSSRSYTTPSEASATTSDAGSSSSAANRASGKTTVVSHAIRLWYDAGATVAMGRCEEDRARARTGRSPTPSRHLVAGAPPRCSRPTSLATARACCRSPRASPAGSSTSPSAASTDPESERFLLFAAVADLLAALSEAAPARAACSTTCTGPTPAPRRSCGASPPRPNRRRLLILGTFRSDELAARAPDGSGPRRVPAGRRRVAARARRARQRRHRRARRAVDRRLRRQRRRSASPTTSSPRPAATRSSSPR